MSFSQNKITEEKIQSCPMLCSEPGEESQDSAEIWWLRGRRWKKSWGAALLLFPPYVLWKHFYIVCSVRALRYLYRSRSAWREIVWINRCLIVYLQVGHLFFSDDEDDVHEADVILQTHLQTWLSNFIQTERCETFPVPWFEVNRRTVIQEEEMREQKKTENLQN